MARERPVSAVLSFYEILTPPARPRRGSARLMVMTKRKLTPVRRGFVGLVAVASVALALTSATSDGARKRTKLENSHPGRLERSPAGSRDPAARLSSACKNTSWPWYAQSLQSPRRSTTMWQRAGPSWSFSKWNDYSEPERRGFTAAIGAAVQGRLMPPSPYVWMHREARLSSDERELVKAWALAKHKTAASQPLAVPDH